MSWKKLTSIDKKKITADWNYYFPALGIYKPMHLMNRVGPLLVGLLLEVKSGGTDYIPTFHVHNLLRPFPSISLGLKTTLNKEYVHLEWHESKISKLANLMSEYALIPYEGDLDLSIVLAGYRKYLSKATISYQPQNYEDMVLISAWCKNEFEVKSSIELAFSDMKEWPSQVLKKMGGLEIWINSIREKASDINMLQSVFEKQILELKVNCLPVRELKN